MPFTNGMLIFIIFRFVFVDLRVTLKFDMICYCPIDIYLFFQYGFKFINLSFENFSVR